MKEGYKNIILGLTCILVGGIILFSFDFPHVTCYRSPVIHYTTDKEAYVTVFLVGSDDKNPLYYSTRLQSPVCMENLCNPIDIVIEWDLLGNFKTYHEIPGDPITKFDHEPFTAADHEKLKTILADKESLLQDYKMEDLVDTTELIYSEEIDGMTGATSKTFENDIVPGAIYTCYTLWHFVNGKLHRQIQDYTRSILDDDLLIGMIRSGEKDYLDYILDSGLKNISPKVSDAIGSLIWNGDPIHSVKAIALVKEDYWLKDSIGNLVSDSFLKLANPVQNALLRYFKNDDVPKDYLSIFLHFLPDLRGNQRNQIYEILRLNRENLDGAMKRNLINTFKSSRYPMGADEYELLSILGIEF